MTRSLVISFSGPEGAGKTTQRRLLFEALEAEGVAAHYLVVSRIACATMVIQLCRWMRVMKRQPRVYRVDTVNAGTQEPHQSDREHVEAVRDTAPVFPRNLDRQFRQTMRGLVCILDAMLVRWVIRFHTWRGKRVLVCDRYVYDAVSRIIMDRARLARFALASARTPDLPILVTGRAEDLLERRPGSSLEYHRMRLRQFDCVSRACPELVEVDCSSIATAQADIRQRLEAVLRANQPQRDSGAHRESPKRGAAPLESPR